MWHHLQDRTELTRGSGSVIEYPRGMESIPIKWASVGWACVDEQDWGINEERGGVHKLMLMRWLPLITDRGKFSFAFNPTTGVESRAQNKQ
jgi:hypothetical protein